MFPSSGAIRTAVENEEKIKKDIVKVNQKVTLRVVPIDGSINPLIM
jgi:hypothetical protein